MIYVVTRFPGETKVKQNIPILKGFHVFSLSGSCIVITHERSVMYKIFDYFYMTTISSKRTVHDKAIRITSDKPFNQLPLLPPSREKIETIRVLRQLLNSSVKLAELKGLVNILPNPNILLNAVILKEASASSEIENIVTTQDKIYQALSTKNTPIDPATKEVLRYREAALFGFKFIPEFKYCT